MEEFPDFNTPGFNQEAYNKRFKESNVIIHATAKEVFYPEHWGPVSIKCAFNGNEYYEVNRCKYRVDNTGFLLLNEGQTYSSYIHSDTTVESFTLNFSPSFINEVYAGWSQPEPKNDMAKEPLHFCERIYKHDGQVSPYVFLLKVLSKDFYSNKDRIEENYILLLHSLLQLHQRETRRMQRVEAVKASTRKELHQRLVRAKDHIDSCYSEDISLDSLAISCLNPVYLLRQFKTRFGLTPRQYIIAKRLGVAEQLLLKTNLSITEVCYNVGYKDLTSFCKLFRQFYHTSPEAYRLQHASKKSIFT